MFSGRTRGFYPSRDAERLDFSAKQENRKYRYPEQIGIVGYALQYSHSGSGKIYRLRCLSRRQVPEQKHYYNRCRREKTKARIICRRRRS